jgi:hypothetical protein
VYDSGALIAGERQDRRFAVLHARSLARNLVPVVPATVLAQVWGGGPRQAVLVRVLRGCEIEPLTPERAQAVGQLRVASGHPDIVDVSVVECAKRRHSSVITSDPRDIRTVAEAIVSAIHIEPI